MITREWILFLVIALQAVGLIAVAGLVATSVSSGLPRGLLAELGGIVLVIWVSISHLLLLRKYKALNSEGPS